MSLINPSPKRASVHRKSSCFSGSRFGYPFPLKLHPWPLHQMPYTVCVRLPDFLPVRNVQQEAIVHISLSFEFTGKKLGRQVLNSGKCLSEWPRPPFLTAWL